MFAVHLQALAEEKQALLAPSSRVRILIILVSFLAASVQPVAAQETSEVALDISPQLFAVLTAVRAAGLVPPLAAPESAPAVARVEEWLQRLPPEAVAPLRAFLEETQAQTGPADLSPYVSLALVLEPPPKFALAVPQDHVPPDAYPLREIAAPLESFYEEAGLGSVWRSLLPLYERAIAERQLEVAQVLLETRGYLRLIAGTFPGRSYTVYLEWLVPPSLINARNYGENYYLVIHPQRHDFLEAIRHQYLHFLLDPVVVKYAKEVGPLARLQSAAERAPRLSKDFRQDMLLLTTESLIQAIELRLQKLELAAARAQLDERERSGYILVRHFFQALEGFEQEEPSIRYYFPELLKDLDVDHELERLASVEFLPSEPAAPAVEPLSAPADPSVAWLEEAQTYLAEGNYAAARERFRRVLEEGRSGHAGALFGLALVASVEQNREQAKQYFLLALEQAREPLILGWTHIYLGRIYDLEGDREQALTHYRAALTLDTRPARVEQEARRGLERPFGEREEAPPPQEKF
jgi:tetratricopeptide (TPR) repeat protein